MRVVFAPDSFSGTLSAAEAARAMATGWQSVRPRDEVVITPMADGGEGTLEVLAAAHPAAVRHRVEVADARGMATQAAWLTLPDGTAVVETAQAAGLHTLPPEHRNPLVTTSYGVGQLLRDVLDTDTHDRPARLVIGLGGSATVDGGAGLISALTRHGLRRHDGNGLRVGGRWVRDVAVLTTGGLTTGGLTTGGLTTGGLTTGGLTTGGLTTGRLPVIDIASDVTAPLLGPSGAAHVFGPQKGATPAAVIELEEGLAVLADVIERDIPGGPWRDRPGAGAAGGMGFALMALLGGRMSSGADIVADLVDLDVAWADLVVTGEGRLDGQTATGKAPALVAQRARDAGTRVAAIAGQVAHDAGRGFDMAMALGEEGLVRPSARLAEVAAGMAGRWTAEMPDD